ncbi:MAG: DUF488 domain-containing protein [Symploca sp. SIO2D2]|nr:DUF488 domain-containing protein [Symploca sp. SIO2D2]
MPPNQEQADAALHEIAEIAEMGNVLLLCSEINPNRCHRVEVANELKKLVSIPVTHLE